MSAVSSETVAAAAAADAVVDAETTDVQTPVVDGSGTAAPAAAGVTDGASDTPAVAVETPAVVDRDVATDAAAATAPASGTVPAGEEAAPAVGQTVETVAAADGDIARADAETGDASESKEPASVPEPGAAERKTASTRAVFDDILIPPRPPLPAARPAADADDPRDVVTPTPTPADAVAEEPVAESTAADVVAEEPVAESTAADAVAEEPVAESTAADAVAEEPVAESTAADAVAEEPVAESTAADVVAEEPVAESTAADAVAEEPVADPTPADVAVEEPITEGPGDAGTPTSPARGGESSAAAADEMVVATPLDVDPDDSSTEDASADAALRSPAGTGHSPAIPALVDDTDPGAGAPGAGAPDDSVDRSAPSAAAEDPTPPDVRFDDSAAETPDAATPAVIADALAQTEATDSALPGSGAALAGTDTAEADGPHPGVADADDDTALPSDAAASDDGESVGPHDDSAVPALALRHITKTFGELRAVDAIDLTVPAGSFYGLVGPNGAGKTTTLSIIAGLLRADQGEVTINGVDAAKRAREAKKMIGVLPDRLRTFDRLTGRQLLSYYGALRGLPSGLVESRIGDLARAFDLVDALARPVSDYSAGMTKKVMLAGAMIHSPRLLVLDEPFEAVDPVSSGVILDILRTYVDHGGTVILSSHGMELVERVCSRVAIIVAGQVLAEGTVDDVRGEGTLEERFRELSGGLGDVEGLEWLHTFSA